MSLSDPEIMEELESWGRFADALRAEDRTLFDEMLRLCHGYFPAIQARESPFPGEGLFMSILLMQHKAIIELTAEVERLRGRSDAGLAL